MSQPLKKTLQSQFELNRSYQEPAQKNKQQQVDDFKKEDNQHPIKNNYKISFELWSHKLARSALLFPKQQEFFKVLTDSIVEEMNAKYFKEEEELKLVQKQQIQDQEFIQSFSKMKVVEKSQLEKIIEEHPIENDLHIPSVNQDSSKKQRRQKKAVKKQGKLVKKQMLNQ